MDECDAAFFSEVHQQKSEIQTRRGLRYFQPRQEAKVQVVQKILKKKFACNPTNKVTNDVRVHWALNNL